MSFIGFWPGNCACETAGWVGREMFISEVLTEVHETDGVAVEHVAKRFFCFALRQSRVRENLDHCSGR
ncbi:hypothetical protein DPMN_026385 [Dreissena polymorpha]|uniref:Uncharacterized protein n=1 Tax=Dreissena polymorpha TaxID=45954 RepID=A0A9D4REI4_DREPO|nr:hypothetical protein DPMN_026385 [Dreissena polymorpha]